MPGACALSQSDTSPFRGVYLCSVTCTSELGILSVLVVFYDALLAKLGLIQMPEGNGGAARGVGWRYPNRRWPQFYVQHPINGLAATWGNGVQVSFLAASEAQVREVWALAIEMGGTNEGKPGFREYASDFYAAYCRGSRGE